MKAHKTIRGKIKPVNSSIEFTYLNDLKGYLKEIKKILMDESNFPGDKNWNIDEEIWRKLK